MRWVMAAFYPVAGIVHLIAPDKFLPIVPDFVPLPSEVVLATGVCEIVGGLALLTRRLRWIAGVMLALYAVLVFPANIKHAIEGINLPPVPDSWWYHGPVPKYHVVVEQPDPNSWRWGWELYRNGQPLPVRLRRGPYASKQGAERAGAKALREFLAALEREQNA
jgi:uncharacterized membrane protein